MFSFAILIAQVADENLSSNGSSFGSRGGCAAVAKTLQAVLDDDRFVVSLDATNAFNEAHRQEAFLYIQSRGPRYHVLLPLLNLFYASKTRVILFDHQGAIILI